MAYVEQECPRCAAPLPARASGAFHCTYCSTPLVPTRDGFRVAKTFGSDELTDPELPRFWIGGARYAVLGRLAQGESSEVFLARRDHRLTERVIAKVLNARDDRDRLVRGWEVLTDLQRSNARGSAHFTRLLPQPVAQDEARLGVRGDEGKRSAAVYRFEGGFVHTFLDVRAAYPKGVPPTAAVWLWKRILELLSFVHESGWVHGQLAPQHLLVHARDHGVRFCGWSGAARVGAANATVDTDLAMSAASVLSLLGAGDGQVPTSVPEGLARLLEATAAGNGASDAWSVRALVDEAATKAFGPPKFVPFAMPGWDIAVS